MILRAAARIPSAISRGVCSSTKLADVTRARALRNACERRHIYTTGIAATSNMQYMVTAYDFKDSDAINRRMAAREQHLKVAGEMHSAKRLVYGGAILSDEGKMVGSTLVYEADSIDEVRELVKNDPYTVGKVWDPENTTIQQIRLAKF